MKNFEAGKIWRSPKGINYLVISIDGRQATLRIGEDGSGRTVRRWIDATHGWTELALPQKNNK